jgi:hypothetical protein
LDIGPVEATMPDELDFEGARVRLKDDALNLTDMWRAAGAPASKLPAEWQRQTQAAEFIDFTADTMGKTHSLLIWMNEGRGGDGEPCQHAHDPALRSLVRRTEP